MLKSAPNKARSFRKIPATNTVSRTVQLIASFPIYQRVLELAIIHEEKGSRLPGYRGWQWHDVEIHPTRLIRLVAEGISRVNLRTRQATFYMLKDRSQVKKGLEEVEGLSDSESLEMRNLARTLSRRRVEKRESSPVPEGGNTTHSGKAFMEYRVSPESTGRRIQRLDT